MNEKPNFPTLNPDDLDAINDPRPSASELGRTCRRCGKDSLEITPTTIKDGRVQLKGTCTICKKFSHWVRQ